MILEIGSFGRLVLQLSYHCNEIEDQYESNDSSVNSVVACKMGLPLTTQKALRRRVTPSLDIQTIIYIFHANLR